MGLTSISKAPQTASLVEAATRQITIIDPNHPLAGLTLTLVSETSPRGRDQLIVCLPNGHHRSLPRSLTNFTDLTQTLPQPTLLPLPPISAWTTLPLAHRVQSLVARMEDLNYEHLTDASQAKSGLGTSVYTTSAPLATVKPRPKTRPGKAFSQTAGPFVADGSNQTSSGE